MRNIIHIYKCNENKELKLTCIGAIYIFINNLLTVLSTYLRATKI